MNRILTDELHMDMEIFGQVLTQASNAQPGLSMGIKTSWKNYADIVEPLLLYGQANWDNGQIPSPDNWMALRQDVLQAIAQNPNFEPKNFQYALLTCLVNHPTSWASIDILLHASMPAAYTCLVEPLSILAASLMKNGESLLTEALQAQVEIVPFQATHLQLQTAIAAVSRDQKKGLVLMGRGLLICGTKLETCLDHLENLLNQLKSILPIASAHQSGETEAQLENFWETLPKLRSSLSAQIKRPVILQLDQTYNTKTILTNDQIRDFLLKQLPLPTFVTRSNVINLIESNNDDLSPASFLNGEKVTHCVAVHPKLGAVSIGTRPDEIHHTTVVFRTLATAIVSAQKNGEVTTFPTACLNQVYETFPVASTPPLPFLGEIGLVTGAASGIGKACAASLLARGAVVVGLDINPAIKTTFDHPSYLGLICDISDEETVQQCLKTIVLTFGGLDIMVLNAGIFPKGCHINNIRLEEFNKVISINLTSNLVLMREAYPLLKCAQPYGRVVMIGSKNIKAPGPGAVAYSTSKAGLAQMARVAAMEWAPDGIRVNIIHPDAVFDTALYSEEVLRVRADYYGMTIEQYKKRNLLKTEITSDIIGEMVAEMCGKLFKATTGAQIQLDGGNDRTI